MDDLGYNSAFQKISLTPKLFVQVIEATVLLASLPCKNRMLKQRQQKHGGESSL
ncbi:eama-like transporter family [Corchorus olitorius]|uniref:Eama-like transporter family n=1 Tax=Corchorus olitorius TaxID=93759 RepID=A0A1R3KJH3_9ROSI|nr:eama-like transporter family [Corchorus olitorius]